MENLLQETKMIIEKNDHKIEDIVFIGSDDGEYECTWEEFSQMADAEYDDSYGSQEVASDLIILFKDGAKMFRVEYDGSEWWNFQPVFKKAENTIEIKELFLSDYFYLSTLDDIHTRDKEE